MRDLAEQIHGLQVDSSTTVIDLMVQNDTFRGVVSGTIRGARTVRISHWIRYLRNRFRDRSRHDQLFNRHGVVWFETKQNKRAEVIVILDLYARLERRSWLDLARLPIVLMLALVCFILGATAGHATGMRFTETTGRAAIVDPAMEQEARMMALEGAPPCRS